MKQDVAELQKKPTKYQESIVVEESLFIEEAGDWRQPYLDFYQHKMLSPNRTDALKIKRKSTSSS